MPKARKQSSVLIVDDEEDILDLLKYNFELDGFAVETARDGQEALDRARETPPDLVVLDILMPRLNGIDACRYFRRDSRLRHIPILFLTALSGEEDQIRGLDVGADSYLSKTTPTRVIVSQARALLRGIRRHERPDNSLVIHDLEIDRDKYMVYRFHDENKEEIRFPRKEFELLFFLASHPGRVFRRHELLDHVWGTDAFPSDRTVDVHVRKIREKLSSDHIVTVKGVGYKFAERH